MRSNIALGWCDSCNNKQSFNMCPFCKTKFCDECWKEHKPIHNMRGIRL